MKAAGCALFVVIFHVVLNHRCANGVMLNLGDITDVIQFGKEIATDILESWHLFSRDGPEDGLQPGDHFPFMKRNERRLMKQISTLSNRIESFEESSKIRSAVAFENVLKQLHHQAQLINHLGELNEQIGKITRTYRVFQHYANAPERYETFTLDEFITWCVSPDNGVPEILEKLHALIIPDKHGFGNQNLLKLLADNLEVSISAR